MKSFSLRTAMMCVVVVMTAMVLTGCGIPAQLSRTVDLAKDVEIPKMPEFETDINEIPEEFRDYVENWEDYADAEDFLNTPFEFQKTEEFCRLPDLQKIRDEATSVLPPFLAQRLEVRSAIVKSIRIIAKEGNFNSLVALDSLLIVSGGEYKFSITSDNETRTILELTSDKPLDLAGLINSSNSDTCIENTLSIVGNLPDVETLFDVLLDLDIKIYLRIL